MNSLPVNIPPRVKIPSRLAANRIKGFSLISTLFVLVILAALGGYMVRLASVQAVTTAMSVQVSRAWFQAMSGLEWATYELTNNPVPAGRCPALTAQAPFTTPENFVINVSCNDSGAITESVGYRIYGVTVTATYGTLGSSDYVVRQLEGTVKVDD